MDWAEASAVLDKVGEEIGEARVALARGDCDHAAEEMGDAMLALGNAPRFVGHDAETTLRRACDKFIERFRKVERVAASRKLKLAELDSQQIENLWQEAKRVGRRRKRLTRSRERSAAPRGLQLEIGFLEDAGDAVQKAVAQHAVDHSMIV